MKVWLIRHGATKENDERRYTTKGEGLALNAVGRTQCARFGTSGAHHTIYTSNSLRGHETSKLLFPNGTIIATPGLAEMDFGEFAGKSAHDLESDPRYQEWVDSNGETPCPGGESREEFKERVFTTLTVLIGEAKNRGDENLIICSHAGTIMAIMSTTVHEKTLIELGDDDFFRWHVGCVEGFSADLDESSGAPALINVEKIDQMPAELKAEPRGALDDGACKGKLVGISVGPGDPDLMTLAAVRAINRADVIFCVRNGGKSISEGIARPLIDPTTSVHRLAIDMSAPEPERKRAYLEAANRIERHILAGEIVGYICLGDITLYSSFGYVAEIIEKRGYRVDFIPGVSSISAAAAKSHTMLAQGNERLLIMTSSALRDKDDPLSIDANKAIVKLDKHYGRLWKRMQESDEYDAVLCERVGLENERIISPLVANTNPSYLSLALIRKKDKDTI